VGPPTILCLTLAGRREWTDCFLRLMLYGMAQLGGVTHG